MGDGLFFLSGRGGSDLSAEDLDLIFEIVKAVCRRAFEGEDNGFVGAAGENLGLEVRVGAVAASREAEGETFKIAFGGIEDIAGQGIPGGEDNDGGGDKEGSED